VSELVVPTAAPAAPQNGAPRNNTGQFSPKAGATGVVPQEGAAQTQGQENAPPSGPTTPEEWGFEAEVDVYGEKQKVKWGSKAEAQRAAQELLAYRKRVREIAEAEKRVQARERMPVDELLRERGESIEEHARRKVLEAAKLVDMTPEQQRIYALEQELAKRDQASKSEQERRQQQERQQRAQQNRQVAVAGLEEGLKLAGIPKTHDSMALLAEIQQKCVLKGLPPLPPDLLAAEANRLYNERGVGPLQKLGELGVGDGPEAIKAGDALYERLGKTAVRAILLAERRRRGHAAAQPRAEQSPVPRDERLPSPSSEKVYGEAEAEAMLRKLRNSR
jgi:hypothetical protein